MMPRYMIAARIGRAREREASLLDAICYRAPPARQLIGRRRFDIARCGAERAYLQRRARFPH